jgi:hypothetical protein
LAMGIASRGRGEWRLLCNSTTVGFRHGSVEREPYPDNVDWV